MGRIHFNLRLNNIQGHHISELYVQIKRVTFYTRVYCVKNKLLILILYETSRFISNYLIRFIIEHKLYKVSEVCVFSLEIEKKWVPI